MPRSLLSYGFEDETGLSSFVLEDPAFVDAAIVRMIEDLELVTYAYARDAGRKVIDIDSVYRAFDRTLWIKNHDLPLESPRSIRELSRGMIRDLARAPLTYDEEAVEALGDFVGGSVYNLLSNAAAEAAAEDSRRIKTRHYLPACERWPYPLNRFC